MKTQKVDIDAFMKQYFDETDEMILILNRFNQIIKMNNAAQGVLHNQYNKLEITKSLCTICTGFTSPDAQITCKNCFAVSPSNIDGTFQVFMRDKNNTVVPYSGSIVELSGREQLKVLTLQNISEQIKTQEILHQKNITKKIINAQENERKRVSRELHDSVVQELLNVMVDFRLLKYQDEKSMDKQLELMEGTMARLMDDIRRISLELRPSSLDDLGLSAALRSHIKMTEQNFGVDVEFHTNIKDERYTSEIETTVYRVIQEAMHNAVKYSNSEKIFVSVIKESLDNTLNVSIEDQGDGFLLDDTPKGTGLGLYGMKERSEIVNGIVDIHSELGKGTEISLTIPLGVKS